MIRTSRPPSAADDLFSQQCEITLLLVSGIAIELFELGFGQLAEDLRHFGKGIGSGPEAPVRHAGVIEKLLYVVKPR